MKAAREVLKGKKTSGRVSLTETEAAAIREALDGYRALDDAYMRARINAEGFLQIMNDASKLYRAGNRGEAAQILGWTTGKRGVMEHHHSIVATYLLQVGMGIDKNQIVENIMAIFGLQSREATIKLLTREKKRLGSLPLPSNWQKV
ncbi:MAG TPA: hypothetical protein PLO63_11545 [Syntrophales bacterium]|nr:hypothetical protein [Syntrophales bacterium]